MNRYRSGSIRVDVSDVIDAICDDDLLEEVKARGLSWAVPSEATDLEVVREAYDSLRCGKVAEARCILDRLLFPKWKSTEKCMAQYQKMI